MRLYLVQRFLRYWTNYPTPSFLIRKQFELKCLCKNVITLGAPKDVIVSSFARHNVANNFLPNVRKRYKNMQAHKAAMSVQLVS